MFRELTDLLMPRECLVCGKVLGAKEEHLCIGCASELPLTYYWERRHNPMADKFNALAESFRPASEPMEYASAAALIFYHKDNPYRRIPQALKYDYNLKAGRYFASMLGRKLASGDGFDGVDAVIPVPLHWTRLWKRGYNQAAIIAESVALELGARYYPRALVRRKRTSTQTRLDKDSRLSNVSEVFSVNPRWKVPLPKHILLVDDTFTTGATLTGCVLALRKALGPQIRISVATLAVVEAL